MKAWGPRNPALHVTLSGSKPQYKVCLHLLVKRARFHAYYNTDGITIVPADPATLLYHLPFGEGRHRNLVSCLFPKQYIMANQH